MKHNNYGGLNSCEPTTCLNKHYQYHCNSLHTSLQPTTLPFSQRYPQSWTLENHRLAFLYYLITYMSTPNNIFFSFAWFWTLNIDIILKLQQFGFSQNCVWDPFTLLSIVVVHSFSLLPSISLCKSATTETLYYWTSVVSSFFSCCSE